MREAVARPWFTLVLVALSPLVAMNAAAQTPAASVTGVVVATDGSLLAGVEVAALDGRTGYRYRALSNELGRYWLSGLPPGLYHLSAERLGLARSERTGLGLPVGSTTTVDFVLQDEAIELEALAVVVGARVVETTQSDVSYVIDAEGIASIPEESREFMDLARLAPGATIAYDDPTVAGTSIGALNSQSVGIRLDGGSLTGAYLNEQAGSVPLLAVGEFEVLTSGYSAKFGQASSGIVNAVSRRGGNDMEVEAFSLLRHRWLTALGAFEQAKPDYNRIHFGAAVGGPIVRDQTHYFVAVERKVENRFETVETGGALPAIEGTFNAPFTQTLLFARVDHRPSDRDRITLRYSGDLSDRRDDVGGATVCREFGPSAVGAEEFGVDVDGSMHSVLGAYQHQFENGLVAETRIHGLASGDSRSRASGGPSFIRPSGCSGANFYAWDTRTSRAELSQDMSSTFSFVGTHRWTLGFSAARVAYDDTDGNNVNGSFLYFGDADPPALYLSSVAEQLRTGSNWQLAAYLQDEWDVTERITLQLGLRYDLETDAVNAGSPPRDASALPFLVTEVRAPDRNNIAPRLGLALALDEDATTVARAGFGLFYNQFLGWFPALETQPGELALLFGPGTEDPAQLPPLSPDPGIFTLGNEASAPVTRQYSLGIERAFSGGLLLRADAVFVDAWNQPIFRDLQTFPVPRYPGYYIVGQILTRGEAEARMLTVRGQKDFEGGNIDVHYTLGERKTTNDWWFNASAQNDPNSEDFSGEMGPAAWDERHRVVGLAQTELPLGFNVFFKGVYASARPFNAVTGSDENGDLRFNDRPSGEGRNARRGPDYLTLDVALTRGFRVSASDLELVLNVYNATNRTNLRAQSVVGDLSSTAFGEAFGAYPKRQLEIGVRTRR
ncbi:MAG: TonB-dependent receptor [Gemmatimonadetes bacterium]|nr:TonB-dependent receptor [Gemmatimonadota bacterium]